MLALPCKFCVLAAHNLPPAFHGKPYTVLALLQSNVWLNMGSYVFS